jgi:CO/xanthine dehydrogenase Mo-binding subunit
LQIEVNGKPYSLMIGAVVGGIGMALMEEGIKDHRYGRW